MSEWISVKGENLPNQGETVLCYAPGLGIRLGRMLKSGLIRPDGCMGYDHDTTHWMPLPEPPK